MNTTSSDAEAALAAMRQSRERLAAAANCPPERHLAFAGMLGGLVAIQAAPTPWVFAGEGALLLAVAAVVAWDRRRTGMFINGYRAGRTRGLTFALLAFTLINLAIGVWFKMERGILWPAVACGVLVTVVAFLASRWWQRIYRRELNETP